MMGHFLWGVSKGGIKVIWVKWEDVCESKSAGGLGVKDLRLVNVALLSKWTWRILSNSPSL